MALEIDTALREGFDRTVSRNGLVLIGVFVGFGLVNLVVTQSLTTAVQQLLEAELASLPEPARTEVMRDLDTPQPYAVDISLPTAAGLVLVLAVIAEALRIATIRAFASGVTHRLPTAEMTANLPFATLNGVVAGLLAMLAVGVSAIFFLIPGIYVALSLLFVRQEIALEGKTVLDALRDSWVLTGGDRWELLGLGVILLVISLIATSPGSLLTFLDRTTGIVLSTVMGSVVTVFSIAVVTRAYGQLRAERAERLGQRADGPDAEF